ncbi:unnamed protein product [Cylicocyclus nassatus]|uniref:Uncharacterized protein n=1 Tax=Cylicocyclus nassatus TaxID=53992 RepID=A0AA36GWI0_CYLNA|nr:unnamed protein product [Cylicocyclus nassatus]
MHSSNSVTNDLRNIALRQSKENIEIVPQEACVQHKGPETMLQERLLRESKQLATAPDRRSSSELNLMSPSREQKRLSVM